MTYPCCEKMNGPIWIDGRYCRPVCDVHGYQEEPAPMTTETERVAGLCERLDHMSQNTRDEYLHKLAGRSSAELRRLAARVDELEAKSHSR